MAGNNPLYWNLTPPDPRASQASPVPCRIARRGSPCPLAGPDDDPVHTRADVVRTAVVACRRFVHAVRRAVHTDADVAGAAYLVPDGVVAFLAAARDRGQ